MFVVTQELTTRFPPTLCATAHPTLASSPTSHGHNITLQPWKKQFAGINEWLTREIRRWQHELWVQGSHWKWMRRGECRRPCRGTLASPRCRGEARAHWTPPGPSHRTSGPTLSSPAPCRSYSGNNQHPHF